MTPILTLGKHHGIIILLNGEQKHLSRKAIEKNKIRQSFHECNRGIVIYVTQSVINKEINMTRYNTRID